MRNQRGGPADAGGRLTRREKEFCRQVREGKDYSEIAVDMHVSRRTVKQYAWQVRAKLDARNQGRLVVRLVETDCVECGEVD